MERYQTCCTGTGTGPADYGVFVEFLALLINSKADVFGMSSFLCLTAWFVVKSEVPAQFTGTIGERRDVKRIIYLNTPT